jgi:hypothetical protein
VNLSLGQLYAVVQGLQLPPTARLRQGFIVSLFFFFELFREAINVPLELID